MMGFMTAISVAQVLGTWPMWGGEPTHKSVQLMRGAITTPTIKWRFATGDAVEWQFSAIADVDADGQMEVVIGSLDNKVYCLRGSDGLQKWVFTTGGDVYSSPALADVDGDGEMEVVMGSCDSKVYCLRGSDGTQKWVFTTGNQVYSSPAIADVDADGQMEVVIGSNDYKVYCLKGSNGTQKWTFTTGGYVLSSPAIADVDGDGNTEVVIGSWDRNVYCLRGSDGTQKWVFVMGNLRSSPAIADVDGDGGMEVVIGSYGRNVYCLRGSDGTRKWAVSFPSQIHLPGALADVDGDGKLEYLVSQLVTDTLFCLNAEDGSTAWQITLAEDVHSPFAGDIDGDGCIEIMVGTANSDAQGYRVFAIDDPAGASSCGALYEEVEEGLGKGIDFRASGKGVCLFMPRSEQVSLSLYDASGKLVQRLYDGLLSQGGHTFIPKTEARGVYLAVLRYQGGTKTLKIVR